MVHLVPGYAESIRNRRVAAYPSLHRVVRAYRGLVERYEMLKRIHGFKGSSEIIFSLHLTPWTLEPCIIYIQKYPLVSSEPRKHGEPGF